MTVGDTYTSPLEDFLDAFASAQQPANNSSLKLENAHVIYSGPCYLVSIDVNNTNASAQYIQLHDVQGAVPSNGAVPSVVFTVAGASDRLITYVLPGRRFVRGIVVANSSTAATLTVGAADCFFDAQFLQVV